MIAQICPKDVTALMQPVFSYAFLLLLPLYNNFILPVLFLICCMLFRTQYFNLIEECVSQIVLQNGGVDPDFATKRFEIDVQKLIGIFL